MKTKALKNLLIIGILSTIITAFSGGMASKVLAATETSGTSTTSNLSDTAITVNGESISEDLSEAVYKTTNVEVNNDVTTTVENTVVNITKGGTYTITGNATNTQVAINVDDDEEVNLILNNVDLTCKTAPAIIIYNALDEEKAGTAGVTITLADNSTNTITGSHIPKNSTYTVNGESKSYSAKYDAAISSEVSLIIDGNGTLIVDSDNEGLETKMHLTINGGNIQINSEDDAINASEDNVSVITINDGTVYANVKSDAKEGDGIDSNGYIYINGGNVYAFAAVTSQDSGLDSDLGIYINGGTVIGTGNMVDEISEDSSQKFIFLQFNNQISAGTLLTITDSNDSPITAYKTSKTYKTFLYSSSDLNTDSYNVYSGGTIEGKENNGLYSEITSYQKGTEVSYSEANKSAGMMQGMGQMPSDMPNDIDNNSSSIIIGIGLVVVGAIILGSAIVVMKKNDK